MFKTRQILNKLLRLNKDLAPSTTYSAKAPKRFNYNIADFIKQEEFNRTNRSIEMKLIEENKKRFTFIPLVLNN
jgi:hypothetical protein